MNNISIISLLDDPELTIASGKRVFSKEETGAFLTIAESVERVKILEQSHEERLKAAQDQARREGRQEGLENGRLEARQEVADKLLELERQTQKQHKAVNDDVVAIALQVVRKIAAGVAPEDMLVALAEGAAAEHLPRQPVSLRVHPQHLDSVKRRIDQIKEVSPPSIIETIVADNDLNPADCILETSAGQVCADLETQLLALEEHLTLNKAPYVHAGVSVSQ